MELQQGGLRRQVLHRRRPALHHFWRQSVWFHGQVQLLLGQNWRSQRGGGKCRVLWVNIRSKKYQRFNICWCIYWMLYLLKAMGFKSTRSPSCTKTITIRHKGSVIQMKQHRELIVNGREISKLPVKVADVMIRRLSSIFIAGANEFFFFFFQ